MTSALHRALGRTTLEFDEQLLLDAIENRIREDDELDWKRSLPHGKQPGSIDEVAKDLAAMANGAGGTIVYGMAEDGTSAASKITPLVDSEPEQHLRQIAYSAIRPALTAIVFERIRVSAESTEGGIALAVVVSPSPESPHLVWTKDGHFRAPKRYGAQTVNMTERDLELAYRERFTRHREADEQLAMMLAELMTNVAPGAAGAIGAPGPHVVGLARPLNRYQRDSSDVSWGQARDVLTRARQMMMRLADSPPGGTIGEDVTRLRRGRRSWRYSPNDRRNLDWRVGPGSGVSLRQRVGGTELLADRVEPGWAPATYVERAIRDLVCLASARAEVTGPPGEWEIVATIVWPEEEPIDLVIEDAVPGYFHRPDDVEPVLNFQASEVVALLPASEADLLEGPMTTMATDVLSQAGLPRLYALPDAMN